MTARRAPEGEVDGGGGGLRNWEGRGGGDRIDRTRVVYQDNLYTAQDIHSRQVRADLLNAQSTCLHTWLVPEMASVVCLSVGNTD